MSGGGSLDRKIVTVPAKRALSHFHALRSEVKAHPPTTLESVDKIAEDFAAFSTKFMMHGFGSEMLEAREAELEVRLQAIRLGRDDAPYLLSVLLRCGEFARQAATIGKSDVVLRQWTIAVGLGQSLAEKKFEDVQVGEAYEELGRALRIAGHSTESAQASATALEHFLGELRRIEQSPAATGDRHGEVREAGIREQIGGSLISLHRFEEAVKELRIALEIHERLEPDPDPSAVAVRELNLGGVYQKLGRALVGTGDANGALAVFQSELKLLEKPNADSEPWRTAEDLECDRFWIYDGMGDSLNAQGKHGEALEMYEKALAIQEHLRQQVGRFETLIPNEDIAGKIEKTVQYAGTVKGERISVSSNEGKRTRVLIEELLREEGVATSEWATVAADIRKVLMRAKAEVAGKPKWRDRSKSPEFVKLTAPRFLAHVYAAEIKDQSIAKDIVRAIDPELMDAVETYISKRRSRGVDLGDASELTFLVSRPTRNKMPRTVTLKKKFGKRTADIVEGMRELERDRARRRRVRRRQQQPG